MVVCGQAAVVQCSRSLVRCWRHNRRYWYLWLMPKLPCSLKRLFPEIFALQVRMSVLLVLLLLVLLLLVLLLLMVLLLLLLLLDVMAKPAMKFFVFAALRKSGRRLGRRRGRTLPGGSPQPEDGRSLRVQVPSCDDVIKGGGHVREADATGVSRAVGTPDAATGCACEHSLDCINTGHSRLTHDLKPA